MVPHYFEEIQGWFDFQDVYRQAVAQAPGGGTLVEVGCWRGRSLSFLLVEAANSGKRLNVIGVDTFRGILACDAHAQEPARGEDFEAECRRNCDRAGYPFRLAVRDSVETAKTFPDNALDFVFIDGAHDYRSARNDIVSWLPKVKWGGTLAGHDFVGGWPAVAHAVRDYFSPQELSFSGTSWVYHKAVPRLGQWLRAPTSDAEWLLYVPFVNRPDLLQYALRSVREYTQNVVVIDQSETGAGVGLHAGPVFRWGAPVRFTSVMNWMQRDAYRRKLRRFLFMHSDAESAPGGVRGLLEEADRLDGRRERWGVIFTRYDALALFNPAATADAGCWDETFLWYVSDVDYYNRLLWAGWGQHQLPAACAIHHGSQTVQSLGETERETVARDHGWGINHYRHKWGCGWDEGDRGRVWCVPYNGEA
ncbi:MAG: class SAM-dependent methyltransferase [Gemmataceae bacterium]|nr:class SAM-dependent methyltransferase [Gemmataceae bacterium]